MKLSTTRLDRCRYEKHKGTTVEDVLAAFKQGKVDAARGRSRNSPRYSDLMRDAAWDRGMTEQLGAMQRDHAKTKRSQRPCR